jgi:head-tail adaptor
MQGEDHRSQAVLSFRKLLKTENNLSDVQESLKDLKKNLHGKNEQLDEILKIMADDEMEKEDHVCQIFYKTEEITELR